MKDLQYLILGIGLGIFVFYTIFRLYVLSVLKKYWQDGVAAEQAHNGTEEDDDATIDRHRSGGLM